jgi:hypothetical protein
MSLFPPDNGSGGGSGSLYPDIVPGINAWSDFAAVSDPQFAGYNLVGAGNVSAVSLTTSSDISGAGNVYIAGFAEVSGKLTTPELQIPNLTTSSIVATLETDGNGSIVITADGGGLAVFNGSAYGPIYGASLTFPDNGALVGVDSINGQAISGLVTNPLSANLSGGTFNISNVGTLTTTNLSANNLTASVNAGANNISNVGTLTTTNLNATNLIASVSAGTNNITGVGALGANVLTFPTTTFTPTYNTGQIWFDGNVFQFSSPVSVPLGGAGFGPVNLVQNVAMGGNLPSYYRYNQGLVQWSGRLSQPNPFGYYGTAGVNCYWLVSFGGSGTVTQYMNINPGVGYIQSMIHNFSIIQVNIICSNTVNASSFPTSADYIMCGNGTCTSSNEGTAATITTSNQLRLIRKVVPYGDSGPFNQGDVTLSFTLIKGVHYVNTDATLDFFFTPSGTQQFGNIFGSSPPGAWLNYEIIGVM